MSDAEPQALGPSPAVDEHLDLCTLLAPGLIRALKSKHCTPGNWHRITLDVRLGADADSVDIANMVLVKKPVPQKD